MSQQAWVTGAAVALIGLGLGGGVAWVMMGQGGDATSASQEQGASVESGAEKPPENKPEAPQSAEAEGQAKPGTDAEEPPPEISGTAEEQYTAAMAITVNLDDLADATDPKVVFNTLGKRLQGATAVVESAAKEQLALSEEAGREDADAARGRAAEVYEHFAAEVKAAKLPGNLPEEEAKLQVLVMEKIAGEYERKAKELRANAP